MQVKSKKEISGSHRFAGLDHLRALAIVLVFLYHYRLFPHPLWVDKIGSFGWTGVDLFFVLSGFLISSQLFAKINNDGHFALRSFYVKRALRILPAYLTVLCIYFLWPGFREWESLSPLWKFITFTQNIVLDLSRYRTFSHAWSLCIEEQFYLIFPIILLAFTRNGKNKTGVWLLGGLFLLGFFMRAFAWIKFVSPEINSGQVYKPWYEWIYYPTYSRLDGLLTGIAIGMWVQFFPKIKERMLRYGNLWLLAGLGLLTAAYFLCIQQLSFEASVYGFPLIAVAYGVMVLSALSPSSLLYKRGPKATAHIAILSYSVYLTHKALIHLTQKALTEFGIENTSTLTFFVCIITCFAGALILNRAIERPFLRYRDKITKHE